MKTYEIDEASRIAGVDKNEMVEFFKLRGYIRPESYGYSATALGIEKNCCINDKDYNALITVDGICKVASAFAA